MSDQVIICTSRHRDCTIAFRNCKPFLSTKDRQMVPSILSDGDWLRTNFDYQARRVVAVLDDVNYAIGRQLQTTIARHYHWRKTYNMYRLLPIPELVLPILLARRAYLEAEVNAGRIALDPARGICSVDDFPIANCEDDWTVPCSAARLTRAGRAFLAEAKIEGELMTTLAEDMAENYSEIVYGEEKDLTAYLLRRTYGEHLRECGCDKAQRERCMGHVQTDESKKNNDFVNDNDLKELAEILSRRPLLNRIADVPVIDVSNATADVVLEDIAEVVLDFSRMRQDFEYCIHLVSNEYHVPPEVTLMPQKGKSADVPYSVEYETHHRPTTNWERKGPPADVNVVYDYQKSYTPKKQKKKK